VEQRLKERPGMNSPKRKTENLHARSSLAAKVLQPAIAAVPMSIVEDTSLQLVGQTSFVTSLLTLAIGLASSVASYGQQAKDKAPVRTEAPLHVSALIGHVNARSGEPIAGATVFLRNFATG